MRFIAAISSYRRMVDSLSGIGFAQLDESQLWHCGNEIYSDGL